VNKEFEPKGQKWPVLELQICKSVICETSSSKTLVICNLFLPTFRRYNSME